MNNERGFALVITLLVTALLVALTVEFTTEVFVDTSARHNFVAGQQASLLAESGITGGIKLLQLNRSTQAYTSLADQWAQPLSVSDERGELQIAIEEESGKLNLNYVSPPNGEYEGMYAAQVTTRLFRKLDLSTDLIDALADWVDLNETPHPGGGEDVYYRGLKPSYGAKNAALETVEELALVRGFAGAPLEKLRHLVTIYPDFPAAPTGPININTAPREIIAALDDRISDQMAQRIVEERRDTPFKSPADLTTVPGFETIGIGLIDKITVKGNVYRIRAEGRVQDVSRAIEAVVRLSGSQPVFLYWREYAPLDRAAATEQTARGFP